MSDCVSRALGNPVSNEVPVKVFHQKIDTVWFLRKTSLGLLWRTHLNRRQLKSEPAK